MAVILPYCWLPKLDNPLEILFLAGCADFPPSPFQPIGPNSPGRWAKGEGVSRDPGKDPWKREEAEASRLMAWIDYMCSQSWLCFFLLVCQLRNRTPQGPCLDPWGEGYLPFCQGRLADWLEWTGRKTAQAVRSRISSVLVCCPIWVTGRRDNFLDITCSPLSQLFKSRIRPQLQNWLFLSAIIVEI